MQRLQSPLLKNTAQSAAPVAANAQPHQMQSAPAQHLVSAPVGSDLVSHQHQQVGGQEQRYTLRRKVLKGCKIIFNNNSSIFDGVIVDISETGAKLKVTNASYIAKQFTLRAVQGNFEKNCEIQWRNKDFIGVNFSDI